MLADVGHIPQGGNPEGKEGTEAFGGVGTAIFPAEGPGLPGGPAALQRGSAGAIPGPQGSRLKRDIPDPACLCEQTKRQHCQDSFPTDGYDGYVSLPPFQLAS